MQETLQLKSSLNYQHDLHHYIVISAGGARVNQFQVIKGGAVCSHACSLGLATEYKKIGLSDQRPLVSGT